MTSCLGRALQFQYPQTVPDFLIHPTMLDLSPAILGNEKKKKKSIQTGKLQKKQSPSPPNTRHILPPQNKRPTCSLLKICDGVILAPEIFHSGARIYIGKEKRKGRLLSALFSIVIVSALNLAVLDLSSCLDRCFLHD